MAGEVVIEARGISKRFCRGLRRSLKYGVQDMFRELATGRRPGPELRPGEFWALRDVGLTLKRGKALGLIGRNGAGKTTLLRVIAGLIRPDDGEVRTWGRLVPLLALGAGFNPVLSGRENIFVNMSILGVPTHEIRKKQDEVIDFAEIQDAVDAPVRTYSSGMAARLGFACAIHTRPDVLLVDEVLSVGDIIFRAKCYRALAELKKRGAAFVLVSHNPHLVTSMCDQGVCLRSGEVVAHGQIVDVMREYENLLAEHQPASAAEPIRNFRRSKGPASILEVFWRDAQGKRIEHPRTGEDAWFCIRFSSETRFEQLGPALIIREAGGAGETELFLSAFQEGHGKEVGAGLHEFQVRFRCLGLPPGQYSAKASISDGGLDVLDVVEEHLFSVRTERILVGSSYYQEHSWNLAATCDE